MSAALVRPGHEQWIVVRIDGGTYDYHVTITAMRDGEPISPGAAPLACECNTDALLSLIDREIATAIYRLRSMPLEVGKPPPLPVAAPAPERAPPTPANEAEPPRRWMLSSLGIAGAAVGTLGLVGLGAGTSLVVAEERQIDGWSKFYREPDPVGYTALAVGAAALVSGVVMMSIDGVRLRRERGSSRRATGSRRVHLAGAARRIGLVPVLDARGVGAVLCERY